MLNFRAHFLTFLALLAGCAILSACAPISGNLPASTPEQITLAAPAIPEARTLTLDYPASIRVGDVETVRLTFAPETAFPDLASVYATHNVLAEARLDMPGVRPAEIVSETLLPGQKVTFYWSLQPRQAGQYQGTVWFYVRFVPKAGGQDLRQPVWAQVIEVEAVSVGKFPPRVLRWAGLAGLFIGMLLLWPFLRALIFSRKLL